MLMLLAVLATRVHFVTPAQAGCICYAPNGRLLESPSWCLLRLRC